MIADYLATQCTKIDEIITEVKASIADSLQPDYQKSDSAPSIQTSTVLQTALVDGSGNPLPTIHGSHAATPYNVIQSHSIAHAHPVHLFN